jgi:hypothetical protein
MSVFGGAGTVGAVDAGGAGGGGAGGGFCPNEVNENVTRSNAERVIFISVTAYTFP